MDMKQNISTKHQEYVKLWNVSSNEQQIYINGYRKIFNNECNQIELFKQKLVNIIL
jgi:hypothetical protein